MPNGQEYMSQVLLCTIYNHLQMDFYGELRVCISKNKNQVGMFSTFHWLVLLDGESLTGETQTEIIGQSCKDWIQQLSQGKDSGLGWVGFAGRGVTVHCEILQKLFTSDTMG